MVKKIYGLFIVIVIFICYRCYSDVSEKSITKKLDNEIVQQQNLIDKKVQQDKVELQESKIQEINKLKLTNEINF